MLYGLFRGESCLSGFEESSGEIFNKEAIVFPDFTIKEDSSLDDVIDGLSVVLCLERSGSCD